MQQPHPSGVQGSAAQCQHACPHGKATHLLTSHLHSIRQSRSGSVVYPEQADEGKPKLFARQSFIVSGEEEEMAETILQARKLGTWRTQAWDGFGDVF